MSEPTEDPEVAEAMQRFRIGEEEARTLRYLGDGVYATFDGYQTWVRTLEGHRVALELPVLGSLVQYDAGQRGKIR